ncbi:mechanosensitive ion channel family protein [Rugosimonospora africana]|uniref:Mechanosensitive ion channel protein MscS n=1 Tax=Rugosimonospora africana TaxID=556532 RepID=A0A8J3R2M2_9ACTN|nr:mechanosensitive ion channel family protein [Rugosimonospora africana]GIH20240.1 mechanosensitive ion channel protein MscS [Rugosimonospora africana]
MIAWLALPAEVPSPSPTPPNCNSTSQFCHWVFETSGSAWLASGSYLFLLKPLSILLIVAVAMIARFLLHRAIDRLVRSTSRGAVPTVLKPLKDRLPGSQTDPLLYPERRRQRAEAIGSVLRSFATAAVFSIAGLMILNELGFDLAPLLASAGIAGVAIGFGAQTLVKDLIAGLFMLLEDQYGVGDMIDVGEANGTVESVGLRITTIRDARGVLWYIRNGEIIRVGNKSQGWAVVLVDVTVDYDRVDQAVTLLRAAASGLGEDARWRDSLIESPEVLGVEQITVDGAVLRTTVKTSSEAQYRVGRELRRRLTDALAEGGISGQLSASRLYLRPAIDSSTPADEVAEADGIDAGSGSPGTEVAPAPSE